MKELTCIVCPRGCRLHVDEENGLAVTGNSCPRGEEYAKKELMSPTRVVTSTVKISGALYARCPVKTDGDIPKDRIFDAVELLDKIELKAPAQRGDVVAANIFGTGVSFVVTKDMAAV